jgi:hypothetical protein
MALNGKAACIFNSAMSLTFYIPQQVVRQDKSFFIHDVKEVFEILEKQK